MMALFLRTTDKNGKSHDGFQWPFEVGATVTAPDWEASHQCGNGLHGLLDGMGDVNCLSFDSDAIWWIVEADDAIDLGGEHKFQSCKVVALGPRNEVTEKLHKMRGSAVHGLFLTRGGGSILTGGYGSTLTGGDWSTLTGGHCSTLTGGKRSTLTGGDWSTLTGGDGSALIFLSWVRGRRRVLVVNVGENGIEPKKAYRANDDFTAVVLAGKEGK